MEITLSTLAHTRSHSHTLLRPLTPRSFALLCRGWVANGYLKDRLRAEGFAFSYVGFGSLSLNPQDRFQFPIQTPVESQQAANALAIKMGVCVSCIRRCVCV